MYCSSNNKNDLNKSQIEQQLNAKEPNTFSTQNQSKMHVFSYQDNQKNQQNDASHNLKFNVSHNVEFNNQSVQKNQSSYLSYKNEQQVQQAFHQQNQQNKQSLKLPIAFQILQKIFNEVKKNYIHQFSNNLTSWFIQSLKDENKKIRDTKFLQQKKIKQQNWPFKDLYLKKNKSQDEIILFQFVNMCAQKIQATFKAYITKKRHLIAKTKLKLFKQKFGSVLKGWKSWNVYNCKKIKQIRQNISNLQKQEEHQILHSNLQKQLKSKKLTYLRWNIQNSINLFRNTFSQIYNNGTWIFQVQKCFKQQKHKGPHHLEHSYYPNQRQIYSTIQNKSIAKKEEKQLNKFASNEATQNKQKNLLSKIKKVQYIQKQKQTFQLNTASLDQRPICTKGSYKIDEENLLNSQNQFLKIKESESQKKNQMQESIEEKQNQQTIQNKKKQQDRKKMQKRHKYDPRKAIEQAKKKKKEQPQFSNQEIKEKKKPNNFQQKGASELKDQNSQSKSRQKTVQKLPKKQKQLNKKDDNSKSVKSIILNKNSTKSPLKVTPKIDCWGGQTSSIINKKQQKLKIKAIVQKNEQHSYKSKQKNEQNSYKSKYLNQILKKKNQEVKIEHEESKSFQENINQSKLNYQRMKLNQKQSRYEQEISAEDRQSAQNQRTQKYAKLIKQKNFIQKTIESQFQPSQRGKFSNNAYSNIHQIKQQQQRQNLQMRSKKQKYEYLSQNMKQIIQKKQNANYIQSKYQKKIQKHQQVRPASKNNQVVVRPIEELQKVYETQYFERFSNLRPKLQMLYNTRQTQIRQMIPVISEQGKFIKRIMKEHSNMFWQQAKKLDSNFIQFIGRA